MVVGISNNPVRKKLLQTSKLNISQCIHMCRSSETSARQLKAINQEDVRCVKEERKSPAGRNKTGPPAKPISESSGQRMVCKSCARQHPFAKKTVLHEQTHARTVVSLIKLLFAANSQIKKSYLRSESEDEEYVAVIAVEEQLNTVASAGNPNRVFATLLVNGKEEKFQLGSGTTVNIMADKTVKNLYGENGLDDMEKTSVTLVMYNKSEVKPVGKKRFKVVNPKNKKKYNIDFLIVTGACKSLLSLRVSEHLQLLTINKQNILAMDCNAVERGLPLPAQRCFLRRRETGRTTTSGD